MYKAFLEVKSLRIIILMTIIKNNNDMSLLSVLFLKVTGEYRKWDLMIKFGPHPGNGMWGKI